MNGKNRIGSMMMMARAGGALTDKPKLVENYAKLLHQLSAPECDLQIQIKCARPDREEQAVSSTDADPKWVPKISAAYKWDGTITVLIKLAELRMTRNQLGTLADNLAGPSAYVDALCTAVVASHLGEFEDVVTTFDQDAWHAGCEANFGCGFDFGVSSMVGWSVCLSLSSRFISSVLRKTKKAEVPGHAGDNYDDTMHRQLGRYAVLLRKLSGARYPVKFKRLPPEDFLDRSVGEFGVAVSLPPIKTSMRYAESLKKIIGEQTDLANLLAEAVLASRMTAVERFVAEIPPKDWVAENCAYLHAKWGVDLVSWDESEPDHILFTGHISRLSQLMNDRMLRAAAGEI